MGDGGQDTRVAFSVVADWSGRKFKMMLEQKDLASMKVEKIKRTLGKFTNLPPDVFTLKTEEGRELTVGMRGGDFNLSGGMLLRMQKIAPAPAATPHREPHPHAQAAPSPAPPSTGPSQGAWDAAAFTSPPAAPPQPQPWDQRPPEPYGPPPAPAYPHRAPHPPPAAPYAPPPGVGRLTPPPPSQQPHGSMHAPPAASPPQPPHGGAVARAPAASPAALGAGSPPPWGPAHVPAAHGRDVSPPRPPAAAAAADAGHASQAVDASVFGPSLWSRNGLSDEQHQLQQKLAVEASSLLGSSRRRTASVDASAAPTPAGAALTTPVHPSSTGRHPASPAALEAKISELRAENEQLRLENSAASRHYQQRVMGEQHRRAPASPVRPTPDQPHTSSPFVDRWLATRDGARSASPARRASAAPDAAYRTGERMIDDDMRGLLTKCKELAESRSALESDLELMKRDWTDERRQRMHSWEAEHREWAERQQDIIATWEADKQLLLSENVPREEVVGIHRKWEASGDGAAQRWEVEKAAILRQIDECQKTREAEEQAEYDAAVAQLRSLNEQKKALYADVQQCKVKLSKSRHEAEQNKTFVVAASRALDTLREQVVEEAGVAPDRAKVIVQAVTEKVMLSERAASIRAEEQQLHHTLLREAALRKHLHNTLEDLKGSIRAIVRMRPVLPIDHAHDGGDDAAAPPLTQVERGTVAVTDTNTVCVTSPTAGIKDYQYYRVLGPDAPQDDAFAEIRPLLQSTLDGFNACVMAYGQTGSGKTYTIMGDEVGAGPHARRGVLPRAVEELFGFVEKLGCEYEMRCSLVELYLDSLHDLLTPENKKCELRQLPSGLQSTTSERVVTSPSETLALLRDGTGQRQVHSTRINPKSSRSHAVFTLLLRLRLNGTETMSKLSFVDLAGSERVKMSNSTGERLKEAQMINKSLSALGDVVAALAPPRGQQGAPAAKPFVPYRNSKLTMILQDALGGNSKTVLFACICPASGVSNITETVSTLVFASRVKNVYNPYLRNITRVQNKAMDTDDDADRPKRVVCP
eukprot:TRINITY_DN4760_c0_g1_i1.p1 TRINITY_DN4760_c0_g1~~TRINITY_DN4760_c0_g1_i1.p1  ORF type:complete len:1040 (+),score=407.53 TRINITY_DN4760_c0_g1_i1:131-3250(+)